MPFRSRVLWLIVASTLIRILIAATLELGNDEVYYYTYALHLQWNYFDHPPGVAVLIKLSTLNLWLTNELFVRSGAIFCAAVGTWLSYKTGIQIRNERTGWYAAILYNTSIYASIIAGTFILPDSPQIIFWLAALLIMIKIVSRAENNIRIPVLYWLLFGVVSGVCVLCKIHGVFLWFGFGLYILFYNRKLLSQPFLYLSFVTTLLIICPILLWNINNHFITWAYHSNRVAVHSFTINTNSFLQAFFGQLFYNNPVNVVLIFISIFQYDKKRFIQPYFKRIFLLTGLPIIVVVTIISLFNSVLPHWSGPGFVTLAFAAAAYLDKTANATELKTPMALKTSLGLILTAVTVGLIGILFYPGTIGKKNKVEYGNGDFTLDLSGWTDFEKQYSVWLQQDENQGYRHLKIVCNKWFPASHIEYYIARKTNTHVIGVGSLTDLHNFAWLNHARTDLQNGETALCIVPSNYPINADDIYRSTFSSVINLHTFAVERNGKTARFFTVFLLQNYNGTDEVHNMIVH